MALELTTGITATDTVLTVSGTLPADLAYGYEFRIGDELLTFERYEPDRTLMAGKSAEVPGTPIPSLLVWQVRRGQGGSTAASHLAAASLVGVNEANVSGATPATPAPWPTGTGGGAVDSVNGQTGDVVLDAGDLATAVGPGPTVEDTLAALAGAVGPPVHLASPDGKTTVDVIDGEVTIKFVDVNEADAKRMSVVPNAGGVVLTTWAGAVGEETRDNEVAVQSGEGIHIQAGGGAGIINILIDGTISLEGPIVAPYLPTADPAVAGVWWNDTGTVKVSAG